ncbi:MAG: response regulator [Spirochaetia bacterium]|jgi:two-component system chemotaxis response regulator CheY
MQRGIIVDDAHIMRLRLREILEKEFAIVAEATNGMEALQLFNEHAPDFLTLDITMPHMNGLETLKGILSAHPDARVVIVSAVGQKQVVFEALEIGAKDFIVKPFDPERVLKSIRRLFG